MTSGIWGLEIRNQVKRMYLVFDIGGTKTRLAVSSDGENLGEPVVIPTLKSFSEGVVAMAEAFKKISNGEKMVKAAGGIRGVLDKDREKLLNDVHLKDWLQKPLRKSLEDICKTKVFLENDTAMVGLGEATVGAGRGGDVVAYITISTGVGGARIVKGKIDLSTYNSEPGHQIIDADATICLDCATEIDVPGAFESLVSGTAFEKRFGKKPHQETDQGIWDDLSKLVAVGLNNTIVHWSPDVVVLGGGMMKSPGISVETVKTKLREILKIYPKLPEIRKAQLGDFGGLHGALAYLRQIR